MGSVLRVPPCRTHWWEKYKGFVIAGKEPREGARRLRSPADLPLNAKIAGVPRERAKKKMPRDAAMIYFALTVDMSWDEMSCWSCQAFPARRSQPGMCFLFPPPPALFNKNTQKLPCTAIGAAKQVALPVRAATSISCAEGP